MRNPIVVFWLLLALFLAGCSPSPEPSDKTSRLDQAQRLDQFLDAIYQRRLANDPVLATKLGSKQNNDRWTDFSTAKMDADVRQHWLDLNRLHTEFDYASLDSSSQLNYRAFEADLELRIQRDSWRYELNPINQIVGLHLEIPGLLMNSHQVGNLEDVQAYVSRLKLVGQPIDQFIAFLQLRESKGFFLPKSLVPRLIQAAESIISGDLESEQPSNLLLTDLHRKLAPLNLDDKDKQAQIAAAKAALREQFIPAYQRLIQSFQRHQELAVSDDGVWRFAQGERFYQFLLRQFTTTDISAEEVHNLGLQEVARIHAEMKNIKAQVGFEGDLHSFFKFLKTDQQFYYPNTAQGRSDYMERAQAIVAKAKARVSDMLPISLPDNLVVKRIEAYREKSAPVGFYEGGAPDGSSPGTVYLGMYDMASAASYDLNALLYHEGIPGHHFQAAVTQTQNHIPEIRKYYVWWSNTAYTEGWALYAEYLAKELGLYEDDPYADFGRLAGELWRACRLVVDSGLHYKRWSRQHAIEYLNENTASSVENNTRAVDRYLAVPGQATAFKIGMMKILELREQARSQLGESFDIRAFHYEVLKNGPLPLSLLELEIQSWVNKTLDTTRRS